MFKDIGILGTGLWQGPVITNEQIGVKPRSRVLDPHYGTSADRPVVVSGLTLSPDQYPRTIEAVRRCYGDPYRGSLRRRLMPAGLSVSDAEAEAGRHALADARLGPGDIGAVLVHSFLPDHLHPRNPALIAHKLGIQKAPACGR